MDSHRLDIKTNRERSRAPRQQHGEDSTHPTPRMTVVGNSVLKDSLNGHLTGGEWV